MSNINLATAMNMPDGTKVYFEDSTVRDIICNEYDSAETYTKGEYCRYNNTLYECTTTIGTPEVWTPAHWTPTNVGNELTSVSSNLAKLEYNKTNGAVDLKPYNSDSNMYTFPADGYVRISSESSSTGNIRVVIRTNNNVNCALMYMNVTSTYSAEAVFVKKGMKAFNNNSTCANCIIQYIPLDMA